VKEGGGGRVEEGRMVVLDAQLGTVMKEVTRAAILSISMEHGNVPFAKT